MNFFDAPTVAHSMENQALSGVTEFKDELSSSWFGHGDLSQRRVFCLNSAVGPTQPALRGFICGTFNKKAEGSTVKSSTASMAFGATKKSRRAVARQRSERSQCSHAVPATARLEHLALAFTAARKPRPVPRPSCRRRR